MIFGIGCRTDIEVIASTLPPFFFSCMSGTVSLHIATTDMRFNSIAVKYWSTSVDAKVPVGGPPAFVHRIMLVPSSDFAS